MKSKIVERALWLYVELVAIYLYFYQIFVHLLSINDDFTNVMQLELRAGNCAHMKIIVRISEICFRSRLTLMAVKQNYVEGESN
jgi:hypothetical protein